MKTVSLEKPAELESESDSPGDAARSSVENDRIRRPSLRVVVGILACGLLLFGSSTAYLYFGQHRHDAAIEENQAQVADVAANGAVALLSYGHGTVDADLAAAQSLLTGDFLEYYKEFTTTVVAPAAKEKSVTTKATVVGSAVELAEPDRATVLLFINQSTTTSDGPDATLSASSVRVQLERVDGQWLIDKFDPV